MAIMKMKRLRLIAMAEDRETILRTLPVSYTHLTLPTKA